MLLPSMAMGQFFESGGGTGSADSIGVDADDDGTFESYLYPAFLQKGANVTFTVAGDTLTIAGPAGSGTIDTIYLKLGTVWSADGWLASGDTLFVDTTTVVDSAQIAEDAVRSWHISNQTIMPIDISTTVTALDEHDFLVFDSVNANFTFQDFDELNIMRNNGDTVTGTYDFSDGDVVDIDSLEAKGINVGLEYIEDFTGNGLEIAVKKLQVDSGFVTTVNDDSGFARKTDVYGFKNGETAIAFDLIRADDGDSLYFLPLISMFMGRYADTTAAGPESLYVNYSDTTGYALDAITTLGDTGTFNGTEGFGLSGGKTGTVLKVKGLIEGTNITITPSGDSALTIAGPAAGGTADSMGVDTDGNGTVDNYLYSTTAGAFHIKKGSNITLTVDTDTVTIAGAAGAGTADSLGVDTDGDGTVDNYLYSTTSMFAMIRESTGIILTVDTDTIYMATTLGTAIDGSELDTGLKDSITAAYDSSQVLDTRLATKDDYTVKSDTAGDGTNVVTHATELVIQEGSNVTLTEENDTLTIASTGGGGTSDSIGIDSTSGGGAGGTDTYIYPSHIHPGDYMEFDVTVDTVVIDIDTTDFISLAEFDDSVKAVIDTLIRADTAGDGSNVANLSNPIVIQEGTNITLTIINGDTLEIAGPAASGTPDTVYIHNDADTDSVTSINNRISLKWGNGIDATILGDTVTAIVDSSEFTMLGANVLNDSTITTNGDSLAVATVPDGVITSGKIGTDQVDYTHIDNSATQASNPDMGASNVFFGANGILFEGTGVDDFEGLLYADPSSDRGWLLPNVTGTIALTSQVILANGSNALTADWGAGAFDITGLAMLEADSIAIGAVKIVDFAGQGLSITANVLAIDSTELLSSNELTTDSTGTGNLVRASNANMTSPTFSTSMQIPALTGPTTDTEGEMAWDADDDAIEVYSGDEAESGLIPFYKKLAVLISQPDSIQTYSDSLPIFHANALMFPAGIEIDLVSITLEADAAYSVVLQEWNNADPPVYQNVITTIATGATDSYAEEAPDTDGNLTVGERIYLVLPATDVPSVFIEVYYHVTQN
jgi:hypothetical protein